MSTSDSELKLPYQCTTKGCRKQYHQARLCKRDITQTRSTCTPQVRQKLRSSFFPQNGSKNQVFEQGAKEGQENSWTKPLQEEEPTLSC